MLRRILYGLSRSLPEEQHVAVHVRHQDVSRDDHDAQDKQPEPDRAAHRVGPNWVTRR
ncbi:MAG: hypothetical protein ACRDGM_09900 [bacterium]